MKRVLVRLIMLLMIVSVPGLIPTVDITQGPGEAEGFAVGGVAITVTPGGQAFAWNLIYELCKLGVPGMCDLYEHGISERWW